LEWPPESFRRIGVTLARNEMVRDDRNDRNRGFRLKFLGQLNPGFAC